MLLTLLFPFLLPQGPTLTAAVNDPLSHGTVGDSLLSLDEAIRVGAGSLQVSALSPAEQARFSGTGTLLGEILIDPAVTPTITLQSPLTDITVIPGVHYHVEIMGVEVAGLPMPVIQGGAHPRVFSFRTHNTMVHGLRIVGGQVAIDARMPGSTSPVAHMAEVMHCEFDGQTTAAVRVFGQGSDESMVMVEDSEFHAMPLAFLLDDQTAGGMVMAEVERIHMDGVVLGCRVLEGGAGGDMSMFNMFRSTFVNGTTLAEKRRQPTSAQQFMFRIVHSRVTCTGNVLDIQGGAAGLTMVHHHHSDFTAGAGQKAFWVYPRTAEFDIHGSEMAFDGDVSIAANLASIRIWQQNNRYQNGIVTLDVDGALPNLLWNHYENCTIDVPAAARSPVVVRSSELLGTNVNSASFLAPITLQGSYRNGGTITGFASEQQPAPGLFLGTTTVTPTEPQVGTSITLAANLPFGFGLVWDIADSYARPNTVPEPVRFYGDPATMIAFPVFVLFQSQLVLPIPAVPSLVGLEFYAQGITLPLLSIPGAPPLHFPRGGLIRPRL